MKAKIFILKSIFFILLFIAKINLSHGQGEFITTWLTYGNGAPSNIITFSVVISGPTNYTWAATTNVNNGSTPPSPITGSGTINSSGAFTISGLPTNYYIELKISPQNLLQFNVSSNIYLAQRLSRVNQWGTAQWTSFENSFKSCLALTVTATDIPNLTNCTTFNQMFKFCDGTMSSIPFRVPNISLWNTSNIVNMNQMFFSSRFNDNISSWNVSAVTDMTSMFSGDIGFNQDLGNWQLNPNVILTGIFDNSAMRCNNYSKTIQGWGNNPNTTSNLTLINVSKKYYSEVESARNNLVNKGWNISGDVKVDYNESLKSGDWIDYTSSVWSCGELPVIDFPVKIGANHTIQIKQNQVGNTKSILLTGNLNLLGNAVLNVKPN